ncbi:hypothetical protein E4U16_001733 [Claviceps sp. LM84 group G4]|nr:hypothetical protein E4U16_001733 [Claviceps sp. LM84 group G4]
MDDDEDDESTDTGDSLEAGMYVDGPASSSESGVICTKWRISEADVPMYRFPSIHTINDKVLGSPGAHLIVEHFFLVYENEKNKEGHALLNDVACVGVVGK